MPHSSHSLEVAWPTDHASHHLPTAPKISSRRASLSIFESRSQAGTERSWTRGRTTATPTVSGPAQAPRPDLVEARHPLVALSPQPALLFQVRVADGHASDRLRLGPCWCPSIRWGS